METLIAIFLIGVSIFFVYSLIQEIQKQSGKEPMSFTKWLKNFLIRHFL